MIKQFTEKDTESYYDEEDKIYLTFWDKNGSVRWAIFENENDEKDYVKASQKLTDLMIAKSGINNNSNVLDIGCGNGVVDIYIAKKTDCKITGIDLSGVRVNNAKNYLNNESEDIKQSINFIKASGENLPFNNQTFTHVISQAAIYHIHDKEKALSEIYRVLQDGGLFVFDDLFKPKQEISAEGEKYVYERLMFDTDFSFQSYREYLKSLGFTIVEAKDLSEHLKKSYFVISNILENKLKNKENEEYTDRYKYLIKAYDETQKSVDRNEVGWAMYLAKK